MIVSSPNRVRRASVEPVPVQEHFLAGARGLKIMNNADLRKASAVPLAMRGLS
jgi:hypothetical protein